MRGGMGMDRCTVEARLGSASPPTVRSSRPARGSLVIDFSQHFGPAPAAPVGLGERCLRGAVATAKLFGSSNLR